MVKGKLETPVYAPDFEIPDVNEQVHHLARYLENYRAIAVIFLSNACPYVRSYIERIQQLQNEFAESGFTVIGINSNDSHQQPEDSFDKMKPFAQEMDLNFPYLWDSSQDVAGAFDAQVTPEAFLLDQSAKIRYRGAIDDSPEAGERVQNPYLQQAIRSLLNDQPIPVRETKAVGSPIQWRS